MYCPLCKAEFRKGFTTCSDCHIQLIGTKEEAAAVEVGRLWTGHSRELMTDILNRLTDAGIVFHAKEQPKSGAWPWISISLWGLLMLLGWFKPVPMFEFHIDVFQKDMAQAQEIVRAVEQRESLDLDDEKC